MAPRAAARLETLGFRNIFEYKPGKRDWMAAGLPTEGESSMHPRAADGARKDVPICLLDELVADVRKRAELEHWNEAVAVDRRGTVLGQLRSKQLEDDRGETVERAMLSGPSTFRPYVPMKE